MRTLLHVIDGTTLGAPAGRRPASHTALRACAAVCGANSERRHRVLLLGGSAAAREAGRLGLRVDARIAPPAGVLRLARRGVERVLDAMDPDGVVWWSGVVREALRTTPGLPARRLIVRLDEGWCEARHVNPENGEVTSLRRPLSPAPTGLGARARAPNPDPGCVRVGLVCQRPESPASLALALGILSVAGLHSVGVLDRRAGGVERAARHVREGGYVWGLMLADEDSVSLLDACDVALVAGLRGEPPGFAEMVDVLDARAWGVPVFAPAGGAFDAMLPAADLARSDRPSEYARLVRARVGEWAGHGSGSAESLRTTPPETTGTATIARQIEGMLHDLECLD